MFITIWDIAEVIEQVLSETGELIKNAIYKIADKDIDDDDVKIPASPPEDETN